MAKQTFTTGQVLTAAQMSSLQQTAMGGGTPSTKTTSYVLVAADAGTVIQMNAAGATTITVNTALFSAGDSVQIQNIGAGTMTITAGTATVNSAGSLAVTQYDGGFLYFSSASSALWFDYTQAGTTSPLTTKGDLYGFSTVDARIPIGANDTVLTADSTQALGLKWAAPSSGGMTLLSTTTLSSATTTISVGSGYNDLYVQFTGIYLPSASQGFEIRYNTVTTGYNSVYLYQASGGATVENNNNQSGTGTAGSALTDANNQYLFGYIRYFDYLGTSGMKTFAGQIAARNDSEAYFARTFFGANSATPAAITQVQFVTGAASFSAGTVKVYGVK
jgi:hypothetical protein